MQALTCSYIRIFVITNRIGGKDYFYSSIPITPHHSLSLHITLGVKYFFIDINQLANYLVAQLRFISFKPFGMIRMFSCRMAMVATLFRDLIYSIIVLA